MAAWRSDSNYARMRRRYTREPRSELVDQVTEGRATVPEAAARLEVPHSTAYKWIRQATTQRAQGQTGGDAGAIGPHAEGSPDLADPTARVIIVTRCTIKENEGSAIQLDNGNVVLDLTRSTLDKNRDGGVRITGRNKEEFMIVGK